MSYVVARLEALTNGQSGVLSDALQTIHLFVHASHRQLASSEWKFPAGKHREITPAPASTYPPLRSPDLLFLQEPPPAKHHPPLVTRCLLLFGVLHVRPPVVAVLLPAVPERRHLSYVSSFQSPVDLTFNCEL